MQYGVPLAASSVQLGLELLHLPVNFRPPSSIIFDAIHRAALYGAVHRPATLYKKVYRYTRS